MDHIALESTHNDFYNNPPATVAQQLTILQSRGMIIEDHTLASQFLQEVYFHRFLSYSVPFFIPGNSKNYRPGTKFKEVMAIYKFDSKLRLLILSAIEKIEISVRTQFVNLSWKYGPHFYLNHKLFRDHKLLNDSIERIQYQLDASNDLLVNEYFHRYQAPLMPPVWIAIELTSIGQLSKWLVNLRKVEDKEQISSRYHLHYRTLQSILDNLTLIRNYAAHHNRIWNLHYHLDYVFSEHESAFTAKIAHCDRIFGILVLICYLLKASRAEHEFFSQLTALLNKYQINTKLMGFPADWNEVFEEVLANGK